MFIISYASQCYNHGESCSADWGSFWRSRLREQVNHKDERSILSYQLRDLVWYEVDLQRDKQSNRPIFSAELNIRIAKYQKWSGFLQDMPFDLFFPGYVIPSGIYLEPKWTAVINGFSEETAIELLISVRPCAGLGDMERNKTQTLISRNSHS